MDKKEESRTMIDGPLKDPKRRISEAWFPAALFDKWRRSLLQTLVTPLSTSVALQPYPHLPFFASILMGA